MFFSRESSYSDEFATQMHDLHDWIMDERIEAWFGEEKEKHRQKCVKLQRLYDSLRLAREGIR